MTLRIEKIDKNFFLIPNQEVQESIFNQLKEML